MLDFTGKVAIVTGSSSGLGEAIAVLLAQRGAAVTLCGRNEQRLQNVQRRCEAVSDGHSERFLVVPGDMKEKRVRQMTVDKTIEKFGRLDVLVPNAAQLTSGLSIDTATEASYSFLKDMLLKSVFFLIQYAIPHLKKTKGNIVNISSLSGYRPCDNVVLYAMMKAALNHMTSCLALDLGPFGIRVNIICPGIVPTRMVDDYNITDEHYRQVAKSVPLGRNGTPEDIAEMAVFLASDAASFVTGQCILVCGGKEYTGSSVWNVKANDTITKHPNTGTK